MREWLLKSSPFSSSVYLPPPRLQKKLAYPKYITSKGSLPSKPSRYLLAHPELGFLPVGLIRLKQEDPEPSPSLPLPVLATITDVEQIASQLDALVFSSSRDLSSLSLAQEQHLRVKLLVLAGEQDSRVYGCGSGRSG